jgi:hypothetical protein
LVIVSASLLPLLLVSGISVSSNAAYSATSQNSSDSFTTDLLNPPTSLAAAGGSSATLTWTATTDTYASGYNIYRATSSGGPYSQVAQVTPRTTTTFVDSPSSGTYYYRATAYVANWESSNSNQVSATVVAPVVFDASSSTAGTATTQSWSHTVGTGNNRILIVATASNNEQANSVTFNGQALTLIGRQTDGGGATRISMWYRLNPASGAGTVQVTYAGSVEQKNMVATTWNNVDQPTPLGTFTSQSGSSGTASITVASATNDVVVDAVSAENASSITVNASQTARANMTNGDTSLGHSQKAGAASVTMSWTMPSSPWAIGAVPLNNG